MGNGKKTLEIWIWTTLGHFWPLLKILEKRAKGHVSLLPGLVLLIVLAVHSALACHSVDP